MDAEICPRWSVSVNLAQCNYHKLRPRTTIRGYLCTLALLSSCGKDMDSTQIPNSPPDNNSDWRFDLELRPPPGSSLVNNQLTDIHVPQSEPWRIRLPVPVAYEMIVTTYDGQRIDADIAFQPENSIPNRNLVLTYPHRVSEILVAPLPPNTYTIRVTPLDDTWPALETTNFIVQPGDGPRLKEVVLPEQFRKLEGIVRSLGRPDITYSNVTVQATGTETDLLSTTSVTDTDGAYSILLPDSTDTTFRLTANLPPTEDASWQFEQIIRVPTSEDRNKDIYLEETNTDSRGTVVIDIYGPGEDETLEAITNARVVLSAQMSTNMDSDGQSYTVVGRSNMEGRVESGNRTEIPVFQAVYDIIVETPAQSRFARHTEQLDLRDINDQSTMEIEIKVDQRTRVHGALSSLLDTREAFAEISFYPVNKDNHSVTVFSDQAGAYEAYVDAGDYLIKAESVEQPPAIITKSLTIPKRTPTVAVPTLLLGKTTPIPGRIIADGLPVEEISVSAFRTIGNTPIPWTRDTTGPDGNFILYLPESF